MVKFLLSFFVRASFGKTKSIFTLFALLLTIVAIFIGTSPLRNFCFEQIPPALMTAISIWGIGMYCLAKWEDRIAMLDEYIEWLLKKCTPGHRAYFYDYAAKGFNRRRVIERLRSKGVEANSAGNNGIAVMVPKDE